MRHQSQQPLVLLLVLSFSCCVFFANVSGFVHTTLSRPLQQRQACSSGAGRRSSLQMTVTGKPEDTTVLVAGATGYIGKFVVQQCVKQGYKTLAVCRDPSRTEGQAVFDGAEVVQGEVTDAEALKQLCKDQKVDAVISCLASRSGTKSDSYAIDYQATLNCLDAAVEAKSQHFVMLSAFCVKKPLLQFQNAKLKFEEALVKAGEEGKLGYSIVRPTAFFKSVSGQLEVIQSGAPFVVFGDGTMCKCNPISEPDLAEYLVNCLQDKTKNNKILPLGGPDSGITMAQQGEMLFNAVGKEPWIIKAPVSLFDNIIGGLDWLAKFFPSFEDPAELARIGKYYAVEDMLTTAPEEKYGTTTLQEHYEKIAREGQEYDPYTSILGAKK